MVEKEIKIKVIKYLLKKKEHDVVIPEVTVGHKSRIHSQVRADIFAVNGDISIYEIKSEKDSLVRLSNQLDNYRAYANRVNVVVAEKFLDKLDIDPNVGIYTIGKQGIKQLREATHKDISLTCSLDYWLSNELKDFLRGYNGISKMDKKSLQSFMKNILSDSQMYHATIYMLKERYLKESEDIKSLILNNELAEFPKRGLVVNSNTKALKELPFGILTP